MLSISLAHFTSRSMFVSSSWMVNLHTLSTVFYSSLRSECANIHSGLLKTSSSKLTVARLRWGHAKHSWDEASTSPISRSWLTHSAHMMSWEWNVVTWQHLGQSDRKIMLCCVPDKSTHTHILWGMSIDTCMDIILSPKHNPHIKLSAFLYFQITLFSMVYKLFCSWGLVSTEGYGTVKYGSGTPWSGLRFHCQQYPYLIGVACWKEAIDVIFARRKRHSKMSSIMYDRQQILFLLLGMFVTRNKRWH